MNSGGMTKGLFVSGCFVVRRAFVIPTVSFVIPTQGGILMVSAALSERQDSSLRRNDNPGIYC